MDAILKTVMDAILNGDWILLVIVLLLLLLFRLSTVVDALDHIQDRELRQHSALLENGSLSDESIFVLEQSINQAAFRKATGISTDEKGRKKIESVLRSSQGTLSVEGVRKICRFIRHTEGELRVPLSLIDKIECFGNIIISVSCFVTCLSFSLRLVTVSQFEVSIALLLLAAASICFIGGIFSFKALIAYRNAKKVQHLFNN